MSHTPYPRSDRDLLARIGRSADGRAGYKQLIRELGLGGGRERRLLLEQLTRMVARGELARAGDDMWSLPKRESSPEKPLRTGGRWDNMESSTQSSARSGRDRLLSGKLDLHRDGFGFVRPDSKASNAAGGNKLDDIFIPPNEINGAMQGDLVLVDEAPPGRDGRRSGRIARVLTRRNPTVVGIFHYARATSRHDQTFGPHGNSVTPLDERVGSTIHIPDGAELVPSAAASPHRMIGDEARRAWNPADLKDLKNTRNPLEGLAVDVEITSFPTPGRPAIGRVIEVLGPPDAFGVDVEIIIRKHHIPHTFPASVLAEADVEAQQTVATLSPDDLASREDFRGLPIVTIDGETARDFDDAVLVTPLPNGNHELQVHIADVSHYVRPGSALDTEARMRGNSVYFPDRAVPMLPHALSSGMCSLLPNEDRLVLSCIMEIDPEGEIVGYRVAEGIIRSIRRMTYTSVQHCIDAGQQIPFGNDSKKSKEPTAEDLAERERVEFQSPGVPEACDRMLALALRLNAKRVRRGSIDFDLPEPIVQFDPDGNMKAIVRSERGWSHRLIEEFMLSANECVATWLESQGIASIYRIHEMPDPKRIVDFEETAAGFGHSLGLGNLPVKKFTMKSDRRDSRVQSSRGRDSRAPQQHEVPQNIPVTPQMYQKLVRRISGTAEEKILSYLMLRSLKQARYAEKNEGHFALASPSYTHFTSPIRRYPDLIVHRLLRAMLETGANPNGGPIRSDDPQPWKRELDRSHGKHSFQTQNALSSRPKAAHFATVAERPAVNRGDTSSRPKAHRNPYSLTPNPSENPISPEELTDIATESSQSERRAADAERELIEWKKMRFMEDKIGDDFPAVVLSCTKYGFFVELDDMFIEGLVPLTSLVGDHYSFRDTDRTIVGARTGHVFSLGQKVHVILDRIDRQQRRLQFALLPGTEPVANTGAPRPGLRSGGKTEAKKARAKEKTRAKKTVNKNKGKRKNR
jgi:ribonuclease R